MTLACYENLSIKTHIKNSAIFFVCNRNPLRPKSVASGVYTAFPQITENTNHRHLLLTRTDHWTDCTVILGFSKFSFLEKQSLVSEL